MFEILPLGQQGVIVESVPKRTLSRTEEVGARVSEGAEGGSGVR
jgi:hypothetical protein